MVASNDAFKYQQMMCFCFFLHYVLALAVVPARGILGHLF